MTIGGRLCSAQGVGRFIVVSFFIVYCYIFLLLTKWFSSLSFLYFVFISFFSFLLFMFSLFSSSYYANFISILLSVLNDPLRLMCRKPKIAKRLCSAFVHWLIFFFFLPFDVFFVFTSASFFFSSPSFLTFFPSFSFLLSSVSFY